MKTTTKPTEAQLAVLDEVATNGLRFVTFEFYGSRPASNGKRYKRVSDISGVWLRELHPYEDNFRRSW